MPESKPLTAAELDQLRAIWTDPTMMVRRLLAERDALAAQLAEARHARDEMRGINDVAAAEIADLAAQLVEARGIARRLRRSRLDHDSIEYESARAAFDALHWPDPEGEEEDD